MQSIVLSTKATTLDRHLLQSKIHVLLCPTLKWTVRACTKERRGTPSLVLFDERHDCGVRELAVICTKSRDHGEWCLRLRQSRVKEVV